MADKKISQLTGATTPLAGTEVLPIVQSSTTKKVSVSDLTAGRGVSALSVTATNLKTSATTAGLDISGFTIQAAGTDTDIDVSLTPKGAGAGRLASTQTGKFIVTSSQNSGIANTVVSAHATDAASLQSCFGNNAVAQTSYSTNLTRIDTSKSAWGFHSLVLSAAFENQSYMRLSYVSAAGAQITALEADYVGNITASTGNLIVGTAGKGIDFSANANLPGATKELLDWYEEGTYTAAVSCGTSGTVSLYSVYDTLSYTRIGRQVTVVGQIKIETVASPVGHFTVNLPYAIGNFGDTAGSLSAGITMQNVVAANVANFVAIGEEADAFIKVYLGDGTNLQSDSAQELQTNTDIFVNITYFV